MPQIGIGLATVLASAIGGGSALASAKMGSNAAKSIAQQQQDLANRQFALSEPAMRQAYDYYGKIMQGGPQLAQAVGPDVSNANMQFESARRNLIENSMSRGGGLDKGLANIEAGRAKSISDIYGNARSQAPMALGTLAQGGTANGMAALAAAQQSKTAGSQMTSAALGSIGSFLARLLSTPGLLGKQQPAAPVTAPTPNIPSATFGIIPASPSANRDYMNSFIDYSQYGMSPENSPWKAPYYPQ